MHPARHHRPFYPRMDGPGSPLGRGVLPWPRTWPWRADWIREGSLASHDMAVYLSNNGNANAIRNARTITECDEQSASHWLRLRAYRRLCAQGPVSASVAHGPSMGHSSAQHIAWLARVRLARRRIGCWQVGSSFPLTLRSGRRGRRFKSGHPDRKTAGHGAYSDLPFALRVPGCPILGASWERKQVTVDR